ncbi:hypothetical protein ACRS7F_24020 [Brucella anthropi]|uniref:hypothetical protein n=1 Tax=Brucella anthropi TaxID=529 RepID=UPI00174616D9|nr:hypothetical protein HGK82_23195 [Ochrobactrum sp. MT180101]
MYRLIFGALAGITATTAMTCFMRLAFDRLPRQQNYPLPPRELTDVVTQKGGVSYPDKAKQTIVAHFIYGAVAGAVFPFGAKDCASGAVYGVLVWCISYLGWIPAMRLLKPATEHPHSRNLLMIGAHLIWGVTLKLGYREISKSTAKQFASGNNRDAHID